MREFSRIFCNILPLTHHPHLKTHRTSIRRWISLGKERNLMQPPEPGAKTKMRVKLFLCRRISCSSRDKDAEMDEIELFVEGTIQNKHLKIMDKNQTDNLANSTNCYQELPWTGRRRAPPSNPHQVNIVSLKGIWCMQRYIFIHVMTCTWSKFNPGPDAKTAAGQTWL